MEDRRVAEYFVVAGLPPDPTPLAEFSCDGAPLKASHSLPPVTDIGIVNRSLGEVLPDGYECIDLTPGGHAANLNCGVLRSNEIYLCYRRGRDKSPLVDIGVLMEGRDRLLPDSQVVEFTVGNHSANINANGVATYITYRRATEESSCNQLLVSEICIIITSKGDTAPHSFCTIDRNLNKGTVVGADIYVCYRKSVNRTNYLAYNAGILDLYPLEPRDTFTVPNNLALFCLPMGATLESWPPQAATPDLVFSTFVLTVSSTSDTGQDSSVEGVQKLYGASVTFYERYPHDKLTVQQKDDLQMNDHFGRRNLIHTNKCLCILSMWPFFDTLEKFLKYLYKMINSESYKIPIERYVWHMLECVPFPSPRRPRILIQLNATEGITLSQLKDSPIPLSGASFRKLVMCMKPEGCLLVLLYALTEQKVLLHSLRPDVLTAVAEALTMIIFPFHWQCPYIPLCPLGLSDLLDAPTPFLLGLDSRFFDLYNPPPDVICIDLDTAAISVPVDKKNLVVKLLPKKSTRILKASLEELCPTIKKVEQEVMEHNQQLFLLKDQNIDVDFKMKRKEQELEVEIQEIFLRFTASILKDYSQYLLPIVTVKPSADSGTPVLFDIEGFVRSRDKAYQKFYDLLVSTQMFSKFIEERSFVSIKDVSLVFFDDCVEKVKEDEFCPRLLEIEPASSEITFFLPPPEPPPQAPLDGYAYEGFPQFRPDFFPKKDKTKLFSSELSTPMKGARAPGIPGSPLASRSKHEIKSSQKLIMKHYNIPMMWAKCLLSTCFSLWFAHLPSFISVHAQKGRVLDLAFHILQRIQRLSMSYHDEVCYRVMMQLCGVYSKPVIAVKTLCEMRNAGIIPNAITYGYYNRAILESKWNPSNLLWNKLRNVMMGIRAFRQSGRERASRRKSLLSLDEVDKTSSDNTSRMSVESSASIDSHQAPQTKGDTLGSDPGYCSISENCDTTAASNVSPVSNSASTYSGADVDLSSLDRSESIPSNSPLSPPEIDASTCTPVATLSSSDTSYSSPTATYNTAPSSPIQTQPTLSVTGSESRLPSTQSAGIQHPQEAQDSPLPPHVLNIKPKTRSSIRRGGSLDQSSSRSLDFSGSDQLRRRLGCVVKSSTAGLSSGVQLGLIETHPLLINDAGLLMTSQLDMSTLDPNHVPRERPTDLAQHLSKTLEKYDQIKEPSMPMPTTLDSSLAERGVSDNLRLNNFGKDEKIVKKLFSLVYSSEETKPAVSSANENQESSQSGIQGVSEHSPAVSEVSEKEVAESKAGDFIDEVEEDDTNNSSTVKTFFKRNTPDRLSNLFKRGVSGADERIRGMWRKGSHPINSSKSTEKISQSEADQSQASVDEGTVSSKPPLKISPRKSPGKQHTPFHKKPQTPSKVKSDSQLSSLNKNDIPLSFEDAKKPLISSVESVEGSGRRTVLAGDPLGALNPLDKETTISPSGSENNLNKNQSLLSSPSHSNLSGKNNCKLNRSNTFTSTSVSSSEDSCSKQRSAKSLWTLNPPFSSGEFRVPDSPKLGSQTSLKNSSNVSLNQSENDFVVDESLTQFWASPFRISGTNTLGLASSVASQSFRQASKHIESLRNQYFDSPVNEYASSPSNFNYRKKEIISGGISSMRSAVSSLSKKYNIIKGAMTPTKAGSWRLDDVEDDTLDGFWSRRGSTDSRSTHSSDKANSSKKNAFKSSSNEPEVDRSLPSSWNLLGPFCVGVWITSCVKCYNCKGILYDEEIMAGWRPDESDLNTRCWQCNKHTVPLLTVTLYDLRHLPKPPSDRGTASSNSGGSDTSNAQSQGTGTLNRRASPSAITSHILDKGKKLEPLTVPYLSPLVLRKELETVLGHDGDSCLSSSTFPELHPILYWNMLWYFSRLRLPSHLPGLSLSSLAALKDREIHESWKDADWRHVYVHCLWDNEQYHQELGYPLYVQLKRKHNPSDLVEALTHHKTKISKDVLESFLTLLHVNKIDRCVEILIQLLKKRSSEGKEEHYSVYRDLLFFTLTALPREEIDLNCFEQEFRREFDRTLPKYDKILNLCDGAPPIPALFCRKYFLDLAL